MGAQNCARAMLAGMGPCPNGIIGMLVGNGQHSVNIEGAQNGWIALGGGNWDGDLIGWLHLPKIADRKSSTTRSQIAAIR